MKRSGMARIVVHETAKEQPRFPLVKDFRCQQIVDQGLERPHGAPEDFERPLGLCGHIAGCSFERAEQRLPRPEALVHHSQIEPRLVDSSGARFQGFGSPVDR